MSLQVTGKITKILEVEKGTSKAGKEWQKINFVVDTGAEFNPEVCFQIFGEDKVENFNKYNKVGNDVDVSFNVSSREFNGKYYYTELVKLEKDLDSKMDESTMVGGDIYRRKYLKYKKKYMNLQKINLSNT